mmetsp:Transcript_73313/g.231545  ORF Transcript_73313/g.231545 Transcript_73313/m.231545 type:complete len:240 (-) Transcript_73313:327-1046(-)
MPASPKVKPPKAMSSSEHAAPHEQRGELCGVALRQTPGDLHADVAVDDALPVPELLGRQATEVRVSHQEGQVKCRRRLLGCLHIGDDGKGQLARDRPLWEELACKGVVEFILRSPAPAFAGCIPESRPEGQAAATGLRATEERLQHISLQGRVVADRGLHARPRLLKAWEDGGHEGVVAVEVHRTADRWARLRGEGAVLSLHPKDLVRLEEVQSAPEPDHVCITDKHVRSNVRDQHGRV